MTNLTFQHLHKVNDIELRGAHVKPIITQEAVVIADAVMPKVTRSAVENVLCLPKRYTPEEAAQKFADADEINLRYVSLSGIKYTPKEANQKFADADEINLRYVSGLI